MTKEEFVKDPLFKEILTEMAESSLWLNKNTVSSHLTNYIKKVCKPTYKILEFKGLTTGNALLDKDDTYKYKVSLGSNNKGAGLDSMLAATVHYSILRVQRLSDNKVFVVGDIIKCAEKNSHLHREQKITGFKVNEKGNLVALTNLTNENGLWIDNIESIPFRFIVMDLSTVITTPDTTVHLVKNGEASVTKTTAGEAKSLVEASPNTYRVFYSKYYADEFSKLNAKVLSYSDVVNAIGSLTISQRGKLVALVKGR